MSKKKITAIIIIVLIIILAIWLYLFIFKKGGENVTLGDFLPFGSSENGGETTGGEAGGSGGTEGEGSGGTTSLPSTGFVLLQISKLPSAGATVIENTDSEIVRFIERGTGHVYDFDLKTSQEEKISNTTIPKIQEAYWVEKGNAVVMRYFKEETGSIETLHARLREPRDDASGARFELEGTFFPSGIRSFSVAPLKDRVFFLTRSGESSGEGFVSRSDSAERARIFTSPLSGWLAQWPQKEILTVTTKPSAESPGIMYFINSTTGSITKIFSGIKGLTTLTSPDATKILYSDTASRNRITTIIYDTKDASRKSLTSATLPEKCTWTKDSKAIYCAIPLSTPSLAYPDAWYQGTVSFSDSIFKIDPLTGGVERVADLKGLSRSDIDVINPELSESEKYLIFINKIDQTVWLLDLQSS